MKLKVPVGFSLPATLSILGAGLVLVILGYLLINPWVMTLGWSFMAFLVIESFLFVSSQLIRTHAIVEVDWDKCIGDGNCIKLCPADVFELQSLPEYHGSEKSVPVRQWNCIKCMACISSCPTKAIEVREKKG
jgi:NAD-dependent dihydropyrimidine dehydrogenase PreA subunit